MWKCFYAVHRCQTVRKGLNQKRKTSPCVLSHVSKMAACRGITYLLLRAAAPGPPVSDRKSSAGLGCTECAVHAAFPKVWTNGWTSSPSLRLRPSSISQCCSAAPPLSEAPSGRDALVGHKAQFTHTHYSIDNERWYPSSRETLKSLWGDSSMQPVCVIVVSKRMSLHCSSNFRHLRLLFLNNSKTSL